MVAIFDLDGTILDSMRYWRGMDTEFLISKGVKDPEGMPQVRDKDWMEKIIRFMNEKYGLGTTWDELHRWTLENIKIHYATDIPFKPGALQLLEELKRRGMRMCLCSSTDRYLMDPALERLDLERFFEFTLHCREFGMEKNDPEIFRYCARKLGETDMSRTVVFEDATYAARTAKRAGCYVVAMKDLTEKDPEGIIAAADQYVEDFADLDIDALPG